MANQSHQVAAKERYPADLRVLDPYNGKWAFQVSIHQIKETSMEMAEVRTRAIEGLKIHPFRHSERIKNDKALLFRDSLFISNDGKAVYFLAELEAKGGPAGSDDHIDLLPSEENGAVSAPTRLRKAKDRILHKSKASSANFKAQTFAYMHSLVAMAENKAHLCSMIYVMDINTLKVIGQTRIYCAELSEKNKLFWD